MNVAFLSTAYTRNLYKGLVEVTPIECTNLPSEDDNVEALASGSGVDATLLVAAVESQWKEDLEMLKQEFHDGVMGLSGSTHVGRSRTAWSNINENQSNAAKKKTGKALAYHVPAKWGTNAKAVWADEDPFYIYVQDPKTVKLVFTIYDEDVIGEGSTIGSVQKYLVDLLPQVKSSQEEIVEQIKTEIIRRIRSGDVDPSNIDAEVAKAVSRGVEGWEGALRLTTKPRMKNKNSQVAMGMAAGAMFAGPMGAAVGAAFGSLYEGQVQGTVRLKLRYLPIPQMNVPRKRYQVLGGLPGVNWGDLYEKYIRQQDPGLLPSATDNGADQNLNENLQDCCGIGGNDLEHCFFINHEETGGCCAVYRSLETKLIVVTFRGTCQPVDLLTDASIVQVPWVEGEDPKKENTAMVHVGFRKSMNSISRRLKEMILAAVAPGDRIEDYDMLVTGHSLGGALATLFTADVGEFGIDAGRALPQTDASDAWWLSLANTIMGKEAQVVAGKEPPRPKSLRMYNFGSPRVGNSNFVKRFDQAVKDGKIDQAYRIVNGEDVVARLPRTMYTLSVDYDHVGSTVLVSTEEAAAANAAAGVGGSSSTEATRRLWVEGESGDESCPVRDYKNRTTSPTAEGNLLGDLFSATKEALQARGDERDIATSRLTKRLSSVTASDITSMIGIDRSFSEREMKLIKSLFKGEGLAHHLEDSYYAAMGRAGGFVAKVGEDVVPLEPPSTTSSA